jgi:hypothetical protein
VVCAAVRRSMATTTISGERMLAPAFMRSRAYIASSISRLVCLEVIEALRPVRWQGPIVTVAWIKPVVHMPEKAMRAVKPWACSNKYSANKPIRSVVAVRSTIVRSIIEVSIGTHRSRPDIYANRNLRLRRRG